VVNRENTDFFFYKYQSWAYQVLFDAVNPLQCSSTWDTEFLHFSLCPYVKTCPNCQQMTWPFRQFLVCWETLGSQKIKEPSLCILYFATDLLMLVELRTICIIKCRAIFIRLWYI